MFLIYKYLLGRYLTFFLLRLKWRRLKCVNREIILLLCICLFWLSWYFDHRSQGSFHGHFSRSLTYWSFFVYLTFSVLMLRNLKGTWTIHMVHVIWTDDYSTDWLTDWLIVCNQGNLTFIGLIIWTYTTSNDKLFVKILVLYAPVIFIKLLLWLCYLKNIFL